MCSSAQSICSRRCRNANAVEVVWDLSRGSRANLSLIPYFVCSLWNALIAFALAFTGRVKAFRLLYAHFVYCRLNCYGPELLSQPPHLKGTRVEACEVKTCSIEACIVEYSNEINANLRKRDAKRDIINNRLCIESFCSLHCSVQSSSNISASCSAISPPTRLICTSVTSTSKTRRVVLLVRMLIVLQSTSCDEAKVGIIICLKMLDLLDKD